MHCTSLARHTALHCTALHCTALHCTALHCTALHCTVLQRTVLACIQQHPYQITFKSTALLYAWSHPLHSVARRPTIGLGRVPIRCSSLYLRSRARQDTHCLHCKGPSNKSDTQQCRSATVQGPDLLQQLAPAKHVSRSTLRQVLWLCYVLMCQYM